MRHLLRFLCDILPRLQLDLLNFVIDAEFTDPDFQGYELTEEEVKISLDQFKNDFCNADGSVMSVITHTRWQASR